MMTPSVRRCWSVFRWRCAAAVFVGVLSGATLGGCGQSLQLKLDVRRGADDDGAAVDTADIRSLNVVVTDGEDELLAQSVKVDRSRTLSLEAARPTSQTVDIVVRGCDAGSCDDDEGRLIGCTTADVPDSATVADDVIIAVVQLVPLSSIAGAECAAK